MITRKRHAKGIRLGAAVTIAGLLAAGCSSDGSAGSKGTSRGPAVACPAIGYLQSVAIDLSAFNPMPDKGSAQVNSQPDNKTFTAADLRAANFVVRVNPIFSQPNNTGAVHVVVSDGNETAFDVSLSVQQNQLLTDGTGCPSGYKEIKLQAIPPKTLVKLS